MVKVIKNNIVISVSEADIDYYRNQGYKVAGEKETVVETVSPAEYQKLEEELTELKKDLEEANKKIAEKENDISNLTSEKEELKKDLEEANKKIAEKENDISNLTSEKEELKKDLEEANKKIENLVKAPKKGAE